MTNRYFDFIRKVYNIDGQIKLLPVDFNMRWYNLYFLQKWHTIIGLSMWSLALVWDSLGPICIAISIQRQSFELLGLTILAYLVRFTVSYVALILMVIVEKNVNLSVQFQATKFFLTVDPIHHTTRSSGQVISKISRGADSFVTLNSMMIFSIPAVIISTLVSFIVAFNIDRLTGVVVLVMNILFGWIAVVMVSKNNKNINPVVIAKEDTQKALQVESLQQIQLIRSAFATTEQEAKTKKQGIETGIATAVKNIGMVSVFTPLFYLLVLGTGVISFLLLNQVKIGGLEAIIAISIVVTYNDSLTKIMNFSNQAERIVTSISNIEDLFTFIRGFGKQTYPVLESDKKDS